MIALLPMKGHSERVPNKNMRNFAGKPLYHAIVNSLLAAKNISKVVIDTDSEVIKADALSSFERVQIIDRPKEICGDFVSMNEIIKHDISILKEEQNFIQTHSTNPLISGSTIDKAIDEYLKNISKYDSLFSVTRIQSRLYWKDGKAINHNPAELLRTQDLPPVFEENSNFYIFSRNSFVAANDKRIGLKPQMFEVNKLEAVDIDYEEDFLLAEMLYRNRK